MQSINEFLVEVPKSHNDELVLSSGVKLKLATKFNQREYVNRIGVVVCTPAKFKTKINVGDIVLLDMNMITDQTHSETLVNKSQQLVDADKGWYRIPPDMIYLYKTKKAKDWTCPYPYLFIEPIPVEKETTSSGLELSKKGYKGYVELHGKVAYINGFTKKQMGLKEGDTVFYKKDREYEFKLDGRLLYHMDDSDILAKVEYDPQITVDE